MEEKQIDHTIKSIGPVGFFINAKPDTQTTIIASNKIKNEAIINVLTHIILDESDKNYDSELVKQLTQYVEKRLNGEGISPRGEVIYQFAKNDETPK